MDTYKLQFRIGPHEFSAEGPVDDVRQDFALWKRMIEDVPALGVVDTAARPDAVGVYKANDIALPQLPIEKLYVVDSKRGSVTLRILPRSADRNADALILLLLGYRIALNLEEVAVTVLRSSLRQSGCTVDRVDSVTAKNVRNGILNKGGRGKGGKYSLTNSGMDKATTMARAMLTS